jgi:hypothetical protein
MKGEAVAQFDKLGDKIQAREWKKVHRDLEAYFEVLQVPPMRSIRQQMRQSLARTLQGKQRSAPDWTQSNEQAGGLKFVRQDCRNWMAGRKKLIDQIWMEEETFKM